ncbi:uncharacterized protein METZ01_LOCUS394667, partial [marine metagenome]
MIKYIKAIILLIAVFGIMFSSQEQINTTDTVGDRSNT